MAHGDRFNVRTILRSTGVTIGALAAILLLAVVSDGTAQSCTSFTVVTTSTPTNANWKDTSSLWTPSGSYPGRDSACDTASDTTSTATTIVIDSAVPNPITSLNLSCSTPGCVIDIQTNGSLTLAGSGTIGSGSKLRVSGGTLTIASGAKLTFQSGSQYEFTNGTVDIQSGGTIDFPTGSTGVTTGGVMGGGGTLSISGGALTIGSVTSPATFSLTAGTLNGPGFLSIGKQFFWDGGTIGGNGGAELAGNGTGVLSGVSGPMILADRVFNNYGYIAYSVDPAATAPVQSPLTLTGTAQFNTYGLTDINSNGTIFGSSGTSIGVFQSGQLQKSTTQGTATISAPMTNNAFVVALDKGTLVIAGNGSHTGTFFPDTGARIAFGASSTSINSGSIFGPGSIAFLAESVTEIDGYYDIGGQTAIANASVTLDSSARTNDFLFNDAGILTLGGYFEMTGTGTWSAGTITSNGQTIFVDPGASLTITTAAITTLQSTEIENLPATLSSVGGTIDYTDAGPGARHTPIRPLTVGFGYLELKDGALISNDGIFNILTDAQIASASSGPPPVDLKTKPLSGRSRAVTKTPSGRVLTHRARATSFRPKAACGCANEIDNYVTLNKSSAGGTTNVGADLYNEGGVHALSGVLNFLGSYDQENSSGPPAPPSSTTLGPGNIQVGTLDLNGGVLNGVGTITGNLNNSGGDVAPGGSASTGTITVTGNYTQGAGGKLDIEIASSGYDVLAVSGSPITPGGTLKVTLLGGFQPANNATFTPFTFTPAPGSDFSTFDFPTWASGHGSFTKSYVTGTGLVLTAVVTPQSADLKMAMGGPAAVNVGDPLSYTIDISNVGPDPSGTFTVDDLLPAGVTGVGYSGTGWSCTQSAGHMLCNVTSPLASGNSLPTLTLSMTAPASGGSITNSASITNNTVTDPTPATAFVTTLVYDVTITKIGPAAAASGQTFTYAVKVTNNGPLAVNGVTVNDTATSTPSGNVNFAGNTGGCLTAYPCTIGTLNAGASVQINSSYSTTASFNGVVNNIATVTLSPAAAPKSASASTTVGPQANLSITKTGPATTAVQGQTVSYTIVVNNAGPQSATNTIVTDPTPAGIAFVSNNVVGGPPCANFPCNLGTLTSGQTVTITSTYLIPPSYSGGPIVNTSTVSSDTSDPSPGNNQATATTNVGPSADVSITKTGPAAASPGANITYSITVSDLGPSSASGVVVSDPTPAGLTLVSATPSQGSCSGTATVTCTIGALAVGPPVTIAITYTIPANYAGPSPITNTATVSSASDPTPGNNVVSAMTTVTAQADLGITKSGPVSIIVGSNISYTITVTNSGSLAAANTFVNDPTPAGLSTVSVSGGGCSAFPCALGTLASGATVTITATYNVPSNYSGSSISNTATASTSSPESNTANNSSTAVTVIAAGGTADLKVIKAGPAQVNNEGFADFAITVTNNGPSPATNVVITDPPPAGMAFVSASGACSSFPCTIGTLAPGASVSVSSRYIVNAQTGTVTNTATVSGSTTDPVSGNNSSSASATVLPSVCPQAPNVVAPLAGSIVLSPVTFSWSSVSGASSYVLAITTATSILKIPTVSTSVTQALPNGDYSWAVFVQSSSASCSPVSTPLTPFTVCNSVGKTVPSVVGATTSGQTYLVQWPSVDGAVSYELQEASDAPFSNPTTTTLPGSSQSFTKNVIGPTPFFYRVRAIGPCSQNPGAYSDTATIVVLPLPPLGTTNINIPVPSGSKTPVTFPIHVDGLTGVTTSFFATVDKPWLAVTPTTGIMPPEGVTFTISADPSALSDGTWTGTVIIVFGSGGVTGKKGLDVAPKTSIPVSISLTSPVSPGTLAVPASTAVIIPSVGHLAGLSSQWQSDIRIANITASSKKVQLSFSAGSATSQAIKQTTLNIDAGVTTALDDIVRNWFGVGAMSDSSNGVLTVQPLDAAGKPDVSVTRSAVASSRTFNASALGTLGQFIPAVPIANFISKAANSASILSLQQIAQTDTFRTNLGLVEATGKPAAVLVSVFNAAGSRILDFPVNIAGGEQVQLNSFLAEKGITLTNGHIEVQATGGEGKVTAYASVIDSRTTDPLLVSGVPLGGTGATRFVIPGVASLDTAAPWRSDVRIFNGSLTPQTTTLTLFPTGNPSASVSNDVTIQPGEVKALDDVVHSTFNLTNTGGALHVTTAVSVPLVVTARTYDQTSTGTLGQFVQAVTPADAVGAGERSLQLLQMEDSPRYRTNLGIAEVTGKAVTAEVTVILPDSKVAPKVQIPLGAFEYRQFAIISSLGLGNTYNARISVRVLDGQGKVTAYGSVIDQKTQDPTFVPAQ